jgi:hypothetical protein
MMSAGVGGPLDFRDAAGASRLRPACRLDHCLYSSQSMLFRFNAACSTLIPRLYLKSTPPIRLLQSSSILLRRNCLQQRSGAHDIRTFVAMAPKQATLGYVKSSQTTIGCGDSNNQHLLAYCAILTVCLQKVLRETKRRRSEATVETLLLHETEAGEERHRDQRRTPVVARRDKEGAE